MDIIKKKTTPNSTSFIIQTRPGYYPSNISNEIVADFKRGLITHETTLSATKKPTKFYKSRHINNKSLSSSSNKDNLDVDYHCSITFNGQFRPEHNLNFEREEKSYTSRHGYPSVYSPLNKSNVKKVDYFKRTVVLPSTKEPHFNFFIKSSYEDQNSLSDLSSLSSESDGDDDGYCYYIPNSDNDVSDKENLNIKSEKMFTKINHNDQRAKKQIHRRPNEKNLHRSYAPLEDDLANEPNTDFSTEIQFKSKWHQDDRKNENLNDICTEFNNEQKSLILKRLADLANENESMPLQGIRINTAQRKSKETAVKVF